MIVIEKEIIETLPDEDLPEDWTLDTIGSLIAKDGVFVDGDWVESKDQDPNGDVRLIQLADIGDGFYRNRSDRYLTYDKALKLGCTFLKHGDVLVARMPDPLGRACIFPGDSKKSVTVVDVCIIRPNRTDINNRWLMYFVNAPAFRAAVASLQAGSTRKRISRSNLAKIQMPVPPPNEQKLIVAEIEKQFSRLDEAVANLKRVKANLKRYKAAVLKAAVEGRLVETEAELTRREGRDYETGAQLLQRIREIRRSQWKGKGKNKEPAATDTEDQPELPEGWVWASVGALGAVIGGFTKNPKRAKLPMKLPYLRVANVYANELRLEEIEKIGVEKNELEKLLVLKNDLLIVEGNGSPDQIGRLAIWDGSINPCIHQNHLIKVRLSSECEPKWVVNWLLSLDGRTCIRDVASSTSGLYTLSVGKVSALPVPLPPFDEQRRIITEVDRRISIISEIETEVETNLMRTERMRQSILKSAFIGKSIGC